MTPKRTHPTGNARPYLRLAGMSLASFVAMYGLMYAMVNTAANAYNNVNQVYMAGLMTGAMVLIELAVMRGMYPSARANAAIAAAGITLLAGSWCLIRDQSSVGDRQFLRSMIPHHAGAILMCQEAPIRGADVKALCRTIVTGQEAEIRQMKELLAHGSG
jgi:uncharacterized protein (DUF305 family)